MNEFEHAGWAASNLLRYGRILFSMYHSMTIRTNRYYILKCVFNKLTYILLFVLKNRFLVMDLDVSSSSLAVYFIKIKRAHRTMKYKAGNISSVSLTRFPVIASPQKLVIIKCSDSRLFRSWKLTRYFLSKVWMFSPFPWYKLKIVGVFLMTSINFALHWFSK